MTQGSDAEGKRSKKQVFMLDKFKQGSIRTKNQDNHIIAFKKSIQDQTQNYEPGQLSFSLPR